MTTAVKPLGRGLCQAAPEAEISHRKQNSRSREGTSTVGGRRRRRRGGSRCVMGSPGREESAPHPVSTWSAAGLALCRLPGRGAGVLEDERGAAGRGHWNPLWGIKGAACFSGFGRGMLPGEESTLWSLGPEVLTCRRYRRAQVFGAGIGRLDWSGAGERGSALRRAWLSNW